MSIFDFEDYKAYVLKRTEALPRAGRGEMLRISQALKMHTSRVSHIFRGEVQLTPEQACALTTYFGLSDLESEYFGALVNRARAGSDGLRRQITKQLIGIRERAKELKHRVPQERALSEPEKAVFYSSWFYSGIRLATSLPHQNTVEGIADYFQMPREKVRGVVDFLLATGLCVEEDGQLRMGPQTTHLEKGSPLVLRHHTNWRLKALARHEVLGADEVAYSCPVSLTKADQIRVREMIFQLIQNFLKTVVASEPAELVACLNIDWFEVK